MGGADCPGRRAFGFSPALRSIRPAHHGSAFGIGGPRLCAAGGFPLTRA